MGTAIVRLLLPRQRGGRTFFRWTQKKSTPRSAPRKPKKSAPSQKSHLECSVQDDIDCGQPSQPFGLSINPTTGLVTWTPTGEQAGPQEINVVATDDRGASATQSYSLNVTIPLVDNGPVISSEPPLSVLLGTEYIYIVNASEANGAALTYNLPTAPAGMSMTPNGQITWTPSATEVGPNAVTLTVSDAQSNTVTQSFTPPGQDV